MLVMEDTDAELGHCYRHPDRETALRCSNCGRFICSQCMRPTPTGQRCPECVGRTTAMRPRSMANVTPVITYALIAINAFVYFGQVEGVVHESDYWLYGPAVANGEWYRLVTSMFLHASIIHIGSNMLVLYWVGPQLEARYGPARYLALYMASGVAGSLGSILLQPHAQAIGASGAIFGLFGAIAVVLLRTTGSIAPIVPLLVINLGLTFAVPGIAYGGHLGGLAGGVIVALAYEALASRRASVATQVAAAIGIGLAVGALAVLQAGQIA
jgi:membrane associated rhomboid family serine protease